MECCRARPDLATARETSARGAAVQALVPAAGCQVHNRSVFSLGFRARGQHKKGHGRDDRLKILHVVMWASSPMMYMKACGYSRVRQTATKGAPVGPLRQKDNTSMPPCSIHFCVGSIGSQQGRGEKRARAKCNHPHFG